MTKNSTCISLICLPHGPMVANRKDQTMGVGDGTCLWLEKQSSSGDSLALFFKGRAPGETMVEGNESKAIRSEKLSRNGRNSG